MNRNYDFDKLMIRDTFEKFSINYYMYLIFWLIYKLHQKLLKIMLKANNMQDSSYKAIKNLSVLTLM